MLAEFADASGRSADAKARKNYAGTSPINRASGKKKVVLARYVHNDRLIDALISQAQSALQASPGARAYYDKNRARGLRTPNLTSADGGHTGRRICALTSADVN